MGYEGRIRINANEISNQQFLFYSKCQLFLATIKELCFVPISFTTMKSIQKKYKDPKPMPMKRLASTSWARRRNYEVKCLEWLIEGDKLCFHLKIPNEYVPLTLQTEKSLLCLTNRVCCVGK